MTDENDDRGAPEPVVEGDSRPEAAAESDPGVPIAAASNRRSTVLGRVAQWALPIALAGGAMGVHWTLNVPDEIQHSPRDQGNSKDKKKAAKRSSKRERFTARDQSRLDREWKRWSQQDLAAEPVRTAWARKFQAVVSKAVVVARRHAFDKAPEEPRVIVTATECHSVRCSFLLRSPFEHELQLLDGALERVVDHNGTIWRTYESRRIPPPEDSPKDQHNLEVVVSFASDMVDSRGFEVGPKHEYGQGPRAAAQALEQGKAADEPAAVRGKAPAADPDDEDDEAPDAEPDEDEAIERGGGDEDSD